MDLLKHKIFIVLFPLYVIGVKTWNVQIRMWFTRVFSLDIHYSSMSCFTNISDYVEPTTTDASSVPLSSLDLIQSLHHLRSTL